MQGGPNSTVVVSTYSLRKKSTGGKKDSSPGHSEQMGPLASRSGSNVSDEPQEYTPTERSLSALIRTEKLAHPTTAATGTSSYQPLSQKSSPVARMNKKAEPAKKRKREESEGTPTSKRPVEASGIKKANNNNNNNGANRPSVAVANMIVTNRGTSTGPGPPNNSVGVANMIVASPETPTGTGIPKDGAATGHINSTAMPGGRSATHTPTAGYQDSISVSTPQPSSRLPSISAATRGGDARMNNSTPASARDRNSETPLAPDTTSAESVVLPPLQQQQHHMAENQPKAKSPDGVGEPPLHGFWEWFDDTVSRPDIYRKDADKFQSEAATHRVESEKLKGEKKKFEKEIENREKEIENRRKEIEKLQKDNENAEKDMRQLDDFIEFHETEERRRLECFKERVQQEENTKHYLEQFTRTILQKVKASGVKISGKENNNSKS